VYVVRSIDCERDTMIDLKKILYCPLDLPTFPKELTLAKLETLYDHIPPTDPDVVNAWNAQGLYSLTAWKVLKLRTKPEDKTKVRSRWFVQNEPGDWTWTEKALNNAPILVKWFEDNLPFKDIRYCAALSSVGTIKSHSDIPFNASQELVDYHKQREPALYRIVIDGDIIDNGFYVSSPTTPKTYTRLPETAPGWVMGATSCLHGNDDAVSGHKILCYAMGDLDEDRHYELIERSYKKYKDFAVVDK
jgi:hypothetical protein